MALIFIHKVLCNLYDGREDMFLLLKKFSSKDCFKKVESWIGARNTLRAFACTSDWIFNIDIFASCIISWTFFKPNWAATMLSIVVFWFEPLHTTTSLHLSWDLPYLARIIFNTNHNKPAAIAFPTHSLYYRIQIYSSSVMHNSKISSRMV